MVYRFEYASEEDYHMKNIIDSYKLAEKMETPK